MAHRAARTRVGRNVALAAQPVGRKTLVPFGVASVGKATAPPTLDALRTPPDVKRWLLWATLAGAAVVLAWMAFRLMRQMRAAPTSEDAPRPPV
ncbi:MAG TPA: hypothetical protein VGL52_03530 [Casimicrobiaceae bacterium]